jgi:hypothetical protein
VCGISVSGLIVFELRAFGLSILSAGSAIAVIV